MKKQNTNDSIKYLNVEGELSEVIKRLQLEIDLHSDKYDKLFIELDYHSDSNDIVLYGQRLATDEELKKRAAFQKKWQEKQIDYERALYEELKAKFESKQA